jgi:predicted outer membrane protein
LLAKFQTDVRQFARQMITDFSEMKKSLQSFLGAIERPISPPESLDTVHQTLIDDLNGADDAHFDQRNISQQKLAHSEAITLFRTVYGPRRPRRSPKSLSNRAAVLERHARMADESNH